MQHVMKKHPVTVNITYFILFLVLFLFVFPLLVDCFIWGSDTFTDHPYSLFLFLVVGIKLK